jgi:SprT protein
MKQQPVIIQPLSAEQQQQVIERTNVYIERAKDLLDIKIKPVEINFNLKGRAAGMYRVYRQIYRQKREIRYNSYIFSKYYDDNFSTTIPHEVAHYASDLIYGLKNIRPHGREWKEIMQVFGADASVTADYDLSGIPLRSRTLYTYQCSCREHQLSSVRHNRINRNRGHYYCSYCKSTLRFKELAIKAA